MKSNYRFSWLFFVSIITLIVVSIGCVYVSEGSMYRVICAFGIPLLSACVFVNFIK